MKQILEIQEGTREYTPVQASDSTMVSPPSVQSLLFGYLKPEQKEHMRHILKVLRPPAQRELRTSLLDYIENGTAGAPDNTTLAILYRHITSDGASGKATLTTFRTFGT